MPEAEEEPPEAGTVNDPRDHGYAWVIMFAVMYMGTLMTSTYVSYGILLPDYVDFFQVSKSEVTVIQSLCIGSSAICGVISGLLTKLYGPRKLAVVSSILSTCGFFISGWVDNLHVLYVTHGILPGISLACNLTPCVLLLTMYFNKRKALAFSVQALGLSLAFVVYPPLFRLLLNVYGRRGAMMLYSGLYLNGLVAAALFRPVAQTTQEGAQHDNEDQDQIAKEKPRCGNMLKNFSFLKDIKYILYLLSFMFIMGGHIIPFFFIPAKTQSLKYSKESAALLLSVLGASGLVFKPVIGVIADRLSKHRTMLYSGFGIVTGILTFSSYFMDDFISLGVYCALCGITAAGYGSLHSTVVSDLIPINKLAVASGIKFTCSGITNALFSLFAGWMVDATGSYGTPFLVFGVVQVMGGLLGTAVYFIQRIKSKNQQPTTSNQEQEMQELTSCHNNDKDDLKV